MVVVVKVEVVLVKQAEMVDLITLVVVLGEMVVELVRQVEQVQVLVDQV